MKKKLILILLLVLIPSTLAQGFGISPSKIDSQNCGSFYVINPSSHKIKVQVTLPEEISINKKSFSLSSEQKTLVEVCSDEKVNTHIELSTKNKLSSSISVPIKLNPSQEESLNVKNKKIRGIIGIITINIVGLALLLSTKWTKKLF